MSARRTRCHRACRPPHVAPVPRRRHTFGVRFRRHQLTCEAAIATRRRPATRTTEHVPPTGGRPPLELVRSTGRRASATAFVRDGRIVVQLPAGLQPDAEAALVTQLVDRVSGRARAQQAGGDQQLTQRAIRLADAHLDGVRATSVTWSARMRRRWGSCTPADGTIRINQALASFPTWVLDYVLVHELAHLRVPGHSRAFHALVERYPQAQRARGFLEGIEWGSARYPSDHDGSSVSSSSSSDVD